MVCEPTLGKLTAHPSLQRALSGKCLGDIERNSILHDVITSPAQLAELKGGAKGDRLLFRPSHFLMTKGLSDCGIDSGSGMCLSLYF